jgi:glutathione S-transferase
MRPWVAMTHKGLRFDERPIRLVGEADRQELERVSPTGRVPVLHHGDRVVPDSLAIIEYLEEIFPAPVFPALWPADTGRRAHARWLAATMHSGFPALRESMSFNWCFLRQPPPASPEALDEAQELLALWEAALDIGTENGPFLFGAFGAVDAMFAPAVWRLLAFEVPTRSHPRSAAYMRSVLEQPAVRAWMDAARQLEPVAVE